MKGKKKTERKERKGNNSNIITETDVREKVRSLFLGSSSISSCYFFSLKFLPEKRRDSFVQAVTGPA